MSKYETVMDLMQVPETPDPDDEWWYPVQYPARMTVKEREAVFAIAPEHFEQTMAGMLRREYNLAGSIDKGRIYAAGASDIAVAEVRAKAILEQEDGWAEMLAEFE